MATYQGKTVDLNEVTKIAKNESEYGKKMYQVYVQDSKKIKKLHLVI
jgi:hypothetical protein